MSFGKGVSELQADLTQARSLLKQYQKPAPKGKKKAAAALVKKQQAKVTKLAGAIAAGRTRAKGYAARAKKGLAGKGARRG